MKNKKKKPRTNLEIYRSIRNTWEDIFPVTKVIPDKRNKPPKHKNKVYEE